MTVIFAEAGVGVLATLTATGAERARSGVLRREALRTGVIGALACLVCVVGLGILETQVPPEARLVVGVLGPDGVDFAGLVAGVYDCGEDASIPLRLGFIMSAY